MTAEILETFRTLAPEFDAEKYSDEYICARIELLKDFCSKRRFGKFRQRAIALLVAHHLTLESLVEESGENTSGAASNSITSGNITQEREGNLQRSYGAVASSASSDNPDSLYDKTLYGRMFLQLRAMCIVPVTIRKGFGYGR